VEPLGRDMAGTIKAVAAIGYRNLETIGALGVPVPRLRRLLVESDMRSTSQHLCPASFYPAMLAWSRGQVSRTDTLAKFVAVYAPERMDDVLAEGFRTAHALGQRYLVLTYVPDADLQTRDGIARLAARLDRSARLCQAEGLTLVFHNGVQGFVPIEGVRPYDILLQETDPQLLKMELDVYWMTKAGCDPVGYLNANPGRYPMLHFKDMNSSGQIVGLGQGVMDFRRILAAARTAGTKTVFFEYDKAPHPINDARSAFEVFKRLSSNASAP
jgi:sugar phosphate isomerase/epimerase